MKLLTLFSPPVLINRSRLSTGAHENLFKVSLLMSSNFILPSEISEDDLRRIEDLVQKETDKYISLVDSELKNKESDLLEI